MGRYHELISDLVQDCEAKWHTSRLYSRWPPAFPEEVVEVFRNKVLAYVKALGEFRAETEHRGLYDGRMPPETKSEAGIYWIRNWSRILEIFLNHWDQDPEFIQKARQVPELLDMVEIAQEWRERDRFDDAYASAVDLEFFEEDE